MTFLRTKRGIVQLGNVSLSARLGRSKLRIPKAIADQLDPRSWLEKLLDKGPLAAHAKRGPEDNICIAFADGLRADALAGRLTATFTHVPHEVGGGAKNAGLRYCLAKWLGLIPGSTDYVFVWADGGGWLEAKTDEGELTEKQKWFRQWCAAQGVRHGVFRTADEGRAILRQWGVLTDGNQMDGQVQRGPDAPPVA